MIFLTRAKWRTEVLPLINDATIDLQPQTFSFQQSPCLEVRVHATSKYTIILSLPMYVYVLCMSVGIAHIVLMPLCFCTLVFACCQKVLIIIHDYIHIHS